MINNNRTRVTRRQQKESLYRVCCLWHGQHAPLARTALDIEKMLRLWLWTIPAAL